MKKRNIRKKAVVEEDAEEEAGPQLQIPSRLPSSALKAKLVPAAKPKPAPLLSFGREEASLPKAAKKPVMLSFGGDEEGSLPVQRSNQGASSRRGAEKKGKLGSSGYAAGPSTGEGRVSSSQISAPGEYSAQRLVELQRNALRHASSGSGKDPQGGATPSAGGVPPAVFTISGSFKPAGPAQDSTYVSLGPSLVAKPQASSARPSQEWAGGPSGEPLRLSVSQQPPKPVAPLLNGGEEDDEDAFIPDADTILRAKQKRERLRSAHLAPDYMPLGGAAALTTREGAAAAAEASGKRLGEREGRDSDSDAELEAEEKLRMSFVGGNRAAAKGLRQQGVLAGMREDPQAPLGREEQDDDEAWTYQQLRKGGLTLGNPQGIPQGPASLPQPSASASRAGGSDPPRDAAAGSAAVLRSLQEGLNRLRATQSLAQKQAAATAGSVSASFTDVASLERQLTAADAKYAAVQRWRAYTADLCSMLQDKSPLAEELEEQGLALAEGRATAAASTAAADEVEEAGPADAAVAAALRVQTQGGAPEAASIAAEAAATQAEATLASAGQGEVDEFGRDTGLQARREAVQRRAKRQARYDRAAQQAAQRGEDPLARWGVDTSEESEGEASHYTSRRAELLQGSTTLFADAAEEYGSLEAVTRQLASWRAEQPGAWRTAYLGLSAPALFAPFVRVQLLQWEPLRSGQRGASFLLQPWFNLLADFGEGGAANGNPQGGGHAEESDLVPRLVRQLVLPLALHSVEAVWRPLSRRESTAVAALVRDLDPFFDEAPAELQELLSTVERRLEGTVAALSVPAWTPQGVTASPRAGRHLARQFGRGVRLLGSCGMLDGVLDRRKLQHLGLEKVVTQQLAPSLKAFSSDLVTACERAERVLDALPKEWRAASRQLQPLIEVLLLLGRGLEGRKGQAGVQWGPLAGAAKRLAKCLSVLGQGERAQAVLAAFKQ